MVSFAVRKNTRCLRGLHLEFVLDAPIDVDALFARAAAAGPLRESTEDWGVTTVRRGVRPFRFELRTGTRPGVVDLMHRATASEAERAADRAFLEDLLHHLEPSWGPRMDHQVDISANHQSNEVARVPGVPDVHAAARTVTALMRETDPEAIAAAAAAVLVHTAPAAAIQVFSVDGTFAWAAVPLDGHPARHTPSVEPMDADGAAITRDDGVLQRVLLHDGMATGALLIDTAGDATAAKDLDTLLDLLEAPLAAALSHAGMYRTLEDLVASEMQASVERELEMQLVLDNMNDALVVVDLDGNLEQVRSAKLEEWLGAHDGTAKLWDYLFEDAREALEFAIGFEEMAADLLPFELTSIQAPSRFARDDRHYAIAYEQVLKDDAFVSIVVTISDISDRVAGEAAEKERQEMFAVLRQLLEDKDAFFTFLDATEADIEGLASIEDHKVLMRQLHTLKGNAALFGFVRFPETVHDIETRVGDGAPFTSDCVHMLAEMWAGSTAPFADLRGSDEESIRVSLQELDTLLRGVRTLDEVQDCVRRWKWARAKTPLSTLGKSAGRLGRRLGKPVAVTIEDNGCRVPPAHEAVLKHCVHLVRNAVDHGLESPDAREAAGKPREGRVTLAAQPVEGGLLFSFEDDGAGVNWDAIASKAKRAGLPYTTQADLEAAFFADNVTTREEVTDVSGRGVGTGAVAAAVREAGGHFSVSSTPGSGTVVQLFLPAAV